MDADVIVIGGGAAGLAAARRLAARSARVILVEARDRLGGRVFSRAGPRPQTFAELGAEFIHGSAQTTFELLREAGLSADPTEGETWIASEAGELRCEERDFSQFAGVFDAARSLPKDESVAQYFGHLERDASMRERISVARAFVEGFDAADPAIASARAIAQEWRSDADAGSARPRGGYAPAFEFLRRACVDAGVQIRLSSVVRRVAWREGAVTLEARDERDGMQTIASRAAIVTLPIGVLRSTGVDQAVAFDPGLPPAKHDALAFLEMGDAVKVCLWFRSAFWERIHGGRYRDGSFFRKEGQSFSTFWMQRPQRSGLVVAWAGGPRATALNGRSHSELCEVALHGLGALFQEPALVRSEFDACAVHDWAHDACSRGAYSYVLVGGDGARETLAAPIMGTLFFAGEATSTNGYGGTVNGALETGGRAAAEAAAALGLGARSKSDG
jgi:monoamine oxidase